MKDSKLSDILQALTTDECADFDRFLDYSLPRTRHEVSTDDIKRLWAAWYKPKKNKTIAHLTTEQTFGQVFPEKPFVKGRTEKIMSELMSAIEKWLGFKQITEGSVFEQTAATLRFMNERQLNNRFELTLNRLKTKYTQLKERNPIDYLETYLIENLDKEYQEHRNAKRGDVNLGATLDALDAFYIVNRLDLMLILVAQRRHIGIDIQQNLSVLAELDSLILKKNLAQNPIIDCYRAAIELLLEEQNFDQFREKLTAADPYLTFEQRRNLHTIERNFCSYLINRGVSDYLPQLGDLNESHLESGYLYYRKALIPSTLLNLTVVATKLRRFDWAEKMLQNHKSKILSADDIEEVWRVAWAFFLVAKGDFATALEQLQSSYKFQDVYFDLTQRRLEIRIYIEQNELNLAVSRNDAFKNYLFYRHREKTKDALPDNAYKPNNEFVHFVEALLNLPPKDKDRRAQLLERLQKVRAVADYDWLVEKLS